MAGTWAKRGNEPKRLRGRSNMKRRERIALRDGYTCRECGRITDLRDGEADHVVALAVGGQDTDSNLAWLCRTPCHENKSRRERGAKERVAIGVDGFPIGGWKA